MIVIMNLLTMPQHIHNDATEDKFTISIKMFLFLTDSMQNVWKKKTHTFSFCPESTAILLVQKRNKIQIALK